MVGTKEIVLIQENPNDLVFGACKNKKEKKFSGVIILIGNKDRLKVNMKVTILAISKPLYFSQTEAIQSMINITTQIINQPDLAPCLVRYCQKKERQNKIDNNN